MAEKREFLETMRELVLSDVIKKEDRDAIYSVCLAACGRALAEAKDQEEEC